MSTVERNEARASPSHRRGFGRMLATVIAFVMVSTSCIGFFASAGDYYPEVWTDRDEYAPGMVVSIYGEGFARDVDVSIELDHPDFEATKTFTADVDYYGRFSCNDYVAEYVNSEVNVTVTVTQVLFNQVLVATTEFADPAVFIEGYSLKPQIRWTEGDIKGYNEGDSVPFSVVVDRSSLAEVVTIQIGVDRLDVNSPDKPAWAIDYLTQYWSGDDTPEVPNYPLNTWPASTEPFHVDLDEGSILSQGWVEDILDESTKQWISVWEFELAFADGAERAIVYFGAHLALTVLDPDTLEPVKLGASFYPGSAAHVRLVSVDPPLGDEGNRDVPIMLTGCLMPPDMMITKSCDPESVTLGDEITFTISWTNIGQAMADEVTIVDDLPSVLDLDSSSFLFWTSEGAIPEYPSGLVVDEAMDSFELDVGTWPGTGADSADDPLTGYLQFTAEVVSDAYGMYENRAIMTYSDDHGGFYPTEEAYCTFQILADPEILIEKTGPAYAHEGDVVTYEYTVTNTGTIDLVDVDVVDDLAGVVVSDLSLAMGESMPLTADYMIPDSLDPVVNTVTATGEDNYGRIVESTDTWSIDILHPEIVIEKVAAEEYAEVGDTIHYTITISNPSDADLFDLTVTDPLLGISWTYDELLSGSSISESVSFVVPEGMDPVANTVLVTAEDITGLEVEDSDGVEVDVVHLDIEVTKEGSLTVAAPGDVVVYWINVTNPSVDTALDIIVWDPMFDDEAPIFEGSLAAEATEYLGPYYFTVPEDTETIYNIVEVDAWGPVGYVSDCDSWTVDVIHPGISIDKYADVEYAAAGDTIYYSIEVTNPSHDATMYVEVYDPMLSATVLWTGVLGPEESYTIGPLAYLVPEGVELVENTATAEADDGLGHEEEDEDSFVVDVIHPGVEIDKWAVVDVAAEGGTIDYYIEVSNPSPDVVMYVEVYDPMLSSEMLWSGYLDPLASHTIGPLEYTVPDGVELVENTAYAEAEDEFGHDEYAEDSVTVEVLYPDIDVTKTGPEFASVGETITYDVYVTNTGDTVLYEVSVVDSLVGSLAVGETLDVGEVLYYTYTHVVPAGTGTLDNTVVASGCDVMGTAVSDTDSWVVTKYGEISGFKTADLNLDADWEEGEPGLENWVITLFGALDDGSTVSRTTLTGTDGSYSFTMLEPGVYTVSEVMQDGWEAVTVDSYTVEVGSGSILSMSFGNIPYGSISGYKWLDADLDGVWDDGEDPIAGWTIYIEGEDASGLYVDTYALTDADGYYCFSDLLPGVYHVSEEIRDGWIATTPTSVEVDVSAVEPFEITGVNFGNVMYGQITGYKWLDEWMNGIWDGIEDPIEGWTIELTGVLASGEPFGPIYTLTDENGFYHFDGLMPGTYIVREVVPDGWVAITPDQHEVTIEMGDVVFCAKFGNVEYGKIDGWKFLDWDMDGFFDGVEDGLAGWEITLEGWLNDGIPPYSYEGTYVGPFTTYTDEDGYWSFDNLLPGLYKITEENRDGWFNTLPMERYVLVGSGSYVFDVKFGNVPYTCFEGYKFEDVNGDGQWQDNEPGLPGWTIVIDGVRNDGLPVHIELETDEVGYWATCFQMLPGTYLISEVAQDGWVATTPDEYLFAIPMSVENEVYTFLFGNFELGSICGYKFEDVNGNGILDYGIDVPIEGWEFYLSGAATDMAVTDEFGYFCFDGLMAGEYTVTEEIRAGWTAMTPISQTVTIESGSEICLPEFLNAALSTVWGYKFEDLNSNSIWDIGEPGISGWTIYMIWDSDPTVYTATTDEVGYYEFTDLLPCDYYLIWEEERDNWVPTTTPYEEFALAGGTSYRVHDFGNFHCVWVDVFKYEDMGSDGRYEEGVDMPVEGWHFFLYDPAGALAGEAVTDALGMTGFWLCSAGEWMVVEETRYGVTPINPVDGYLTVEVLSGDEPNTLMFGNFWDVLIEVFKYEDVNSNGVYDEGIDVPLEGWTIWFYSYEDDMAYSALTDAAGMASFALTHADMVRISEDLPEGWCQITPGSPYYYEPFVLSGSTFDVFEFGNFECVDIEVFKYEDVNSDGRYEEGVDVPVEGWYFTLVDVTGAVVDCGFTGADGRFVFHVCEAGQWTVVEETRDYVTPVNPADGQLPVETYSGAEPETLMFGNFWDVLIEVFKYEDVNSNGVYDQDIDVPLGDWEFTVTGPCFAEPLVVLTDADGYATFWVTAAGTYVVDEEDRLGWTHITPADGDLEATVASGDLSVRLEFGNFEDVTILVFKFDDRYADGQFCPDEGDVPIEGWAFELYVLVGDVWVLVDSGVTGVDGTLEFVLTMAGEYKVVETVEPGWFVVMPIDGEYLFEAGSGDGPLEFVFANFKLGKIFGYKWNDLDGDGVWDEGEPGLEGWTIWVEGSLWVGDVGYYLLAFDITDADGYYEIVSLPPGMYTVWEVAPEGEDDWIPTSPAAVYVDVIGHTEARVDFLNFELGCIEGYKYEDYDGDGVLDPEDLAIEGWYVYLYLDGDLEAVALTDASGHYSFCGLGPGEYTVMEEDRTGWMPTNDPSEVVVMTSGALVSVHDFLNFELGEITGWKFEDVNSNGVWDEGEPAIEGWKVTMIKDADPYEYYEYTDEDGMFVFSGLEADYYMLWEELVDGWTPTTTSWALVDIFSGSVIELDPFGNFQDVPMDLFKYEDVDGNGVFNTGDVPLESWEFTVTGPCFATPLVVTTDVDGMAAFVITAAGTYTVTETVPGGWVPVEPETGSIEVTVDSGDRLNTLLFGNFMLGEITGLKFYDWNMNGVQDDGELGLANWVIWVEGTLLSGETVFFTRVTDSGGYYEVTGLLAGTYVVSERLEYAPTGWEPTTPTSVEIDVASGSAMSVSFGNVVLGIIEGYKFYDKDRDGVQDEGEPGLPGWTIILEGTTDEGLAVCETRVTDADGYYLFDEVQPGMYTVTETILDTWTATTPVPVTVDVSGTLEYFEQQVDIGNIRYAKVFGYKFMDTIPAVFPYWPNGVFDDDEVGLANWEITLQGWTEAGEWVDLVRYTSDGDDLGYYSFEELLPGIYWVNETLLWGWMASTPISNMVMVYPYPYGMVVYSIDFGNLLPEPDPDVPFFLEKGWNLWSMPIVVDGLTASGLLQAIGDNGLMVTMLDEAEGRYYSHYADLPGTDDFAIEAGEGYFVYVTADTSFILRGYFPEESSTSLQGGWNFIGYGSLQPEMASQLLDRVGGLMFTCYDEESGRYVSYMSGESAEYDFLVTPGKAYYIWVSGPCDLVFA